MDRDQRDFQGQFHSVKRANRKRPPAVTAAAELK